ncbi:unnamed protein product, partial [Vitis vinifera]
MSCVPTSIFKSYILLMGSDVKLINYHYYFNMKFLKIIEKYFLKHPSCFSVDKRTEEADNLVRFIYNQACFTSNSSALTVHFLAHLPFPFRFYLLLGSLVCGEVGPMCLGPSQEILKEHDAVFASRPITMASHHLSRGFLTTALSPWGEHHNFTDSSVVNVRNAVRQYTGNVVRKMMFSRRYFGEGRKDGGPGLEEEEHVNSLFTTLVYLYVFSPSDYLPCLRVFDLDGHEKMVKEALSIINKHHDPIVDERIIQWRNGEKKEVEDILDVFITISDTKGKPLLSVEEIKAQLIELMIEIVDNPAHAAEWAMAEMINKPEIMQKAVEEIDRVVAKDRLVQESDIAQLKYVKACAREALRLHPMAPFNVPHVSMADAVVAGYFIPKGSHVLLSRVGLGRNPRVWEEPLKFKPERHMNDEVVDLAEPELRFISFSTGRRGCPGTALGTALTVTLLARLLQCFSWSVPPNQDQIDLTESMNELFLAKPLHAHAKPRLPASMYGN